MEICGRNIYVVFTRMGEDFGEWDSRNRTIYVNSDLSKEDQCHVLAHEVMHVLIETAHGSDKENLTQEEVCNLGELLFSLTGTIRDLVEAS